jgi:predicted DCC family thiol-disulfide oxidoreductase YuxK
VRFLLERDTKGGLSFASLGGPTGRELLSRHPSLIHEDSVILVEHLRDPAREAVWTRSSAALRIAGYLGGWWRLFALIRWIPASLRDVPYKLFARSRYRLFGRLDRCWVPPEEHRRRFLDLD